MDIYSKLSSFVAGSQATERYRDTISISYEQALEIINLIDKPVETTNEQPTLPTDLKIELSKVMSKHINLRNSDKITDRDLYHSFLDWEKEMYRLIV